MTSRSDVVRLDGITKSAGEWADERGLHWSTVRDRRSKGRGWHDALRPTRLVCSADTQVTFDDVTKTAFEWAAERGLEWQTVKVRRYRGASWAAALCVGRKPRSDSGKPKKPVKTKAPKARFCSKDEVVMLGGVAKPAHQWATERGLSWHQVHARRSRGYGWPSALQIGDMRVGRMRFEEGEWCGY